MANQRPGRHGGRFFSICGDNPQSSKKSERFNNSWFKLLLERITDKLLSETGREGVLGIYLCGSFATGEGTVIVRGDEALFISDLDLVMLVDSLDLHARILRDRKRLGVICQGLSEEAVFTEGISVGVYHLSELPELVPSPLTLDMKQKAVTLFGDRDLPDRIRAEEVTEYEGIRLLENRACSLMGSIHLSGSSDPASRIELAYSISRVYTDILTAILIFRKRYLPGYRARLKELRAVREEEKDILSEEIFSRIAEWTEYKLCPSERDPGEDIWKKWELAGRDLIDHWRIFRSKRPGKEVQSRGVEEILGEYRSRYTLWQRLKRWAGYLGRFSPFRRLWKILYLNRSILRLAPSELVTYTGIRVLNHITEGSKKSSVLSYGRGFARMRAEATKDAASLHELWTEVNK
ncbi:MAG: hypothetical protein GF417_07995 [Candidatus Latescibacteria bacterium]|nr:hypothetical protein [bacterium]MBD3424362.1 hypothetical protein [Candidatus Latescibacterota bacterium]